LDTGTRHDADSNLASQISALAATVGDNTAAILAEASARAGADSAQASSISTLQTTVGGHTTSISQQATSINGLSAQFTVKIDANGYVSGFGLASTPKDGAPFSEFIVRADSFSIASPAGPGSGLSPVEPFIVRTTSTTINGVTVPPGVYIRDGFIQNGTINNLMFDRATGNKIALVDADIVNIRGEKVVAHTLDVNIAAAGLILADMVDTRGLTIKDGSGNIIFGSGTPLSNARIVPAANWLNDNIKLGGTNLVRGLASWGPNNHSIETSGAPVRGGYYARLVTNNGSSVDSPVMTTLRQNTDYTLSFWARVPDGSTRTLHADLFPDTLPETAFTVAGSGYQRFTTTWNTASADIASCKLRFFHHLVADSEIHIWDPMLEEGNKASDWSPHPDEVKNANITVSNGTLMGIGAGAGTVVDNSAVPYGTNLVSNSDLAAAIAPWVAGWNQTGWPSVAVGRDLAGSAWSPTGGHTLTILRWGGAATGVQDAQNSSMIPVVAGTRYEVSAYLGCHRADAAVCVAFYDSTGTFQSELDVWASGFGRQAGGTKLSDYVRPFGFAVAPAASAYATVFLRQGPADDGATDCYTFATRFFFGRAAPSQTQPSEWSPAGVTDTRQLGYDGDLNATYGATFGTNIYGQITPSNVSTYIQAGAIDQAYIGQFIRSYDYNGSQGWSLDRNGLLDMVGGRIRLRSATSGVRREMDSGSDYYYNASNVRQIEISIS
jgi:hypothetical protein